MNVNAIEPVRTAPPAYRGGQIHECDPAAVERLKRLMAEQRQAKEADEGARLLRQNDDAARLLTEAKRRKARQKAPTKTAAAPRPTRGPKPVPKRRRFTADQLAAAMAAHVAGRLWREIAAELGVNRTSLRKELVAAGYNPCGQKRASKGRASKGRRARFSDDEVRAIYTRQLAGERLDKIAAEYGISPQLLNRYFKRLGLPSARSLGKAAKSIKASKASRFTKEQLQAAVAAHESGQLWREIAAGMGVPRSSLMDAIKPRKPRAHANGNGARSDEP